MSAPIIEVYPDPAALANAAAQYYVRVAEAATAERGVFTVALAGGSTPAGLYRLLAEPSWAAQVAWERTLVFFGDERCVPPDHPWSNYRMAREALLNHVLLPSQNIYRMIGEQNPAAAAFDYAQMLRQAFGLTGQAWPQFDLVLLGMGDDGHTASLFPGMAALDEAQRLVVATDVPRYVPPPVPRITLTLPVLNAARYVIFLVSGASKAKKMRVILGSVQAGHPGHSAPKMKDLPAAEVRPEAGQLIWLLDRAAATEL